MFVFSFFISLLVLQIFDRISGHKCVYFVFGCIIFIYDRFTFISRD